MYACMYVSMYVCMYVCMYVRTYVHMYVRTYVCVHVVLHGQTLYSHRAFLIRDYKHPRKGSGTIHRVHWYSYQRCGDGC